MIKKGLAIISLWLLGVLRLILSIVFWGVVVISSIVFLGLLSKTLLEKTSLFAGIVYPKKVFKFYSIYEEGQSPDNALDRLSAGASYHQTFTIAITGQGLNNSFKKIFLPTILVNKPYEVLHIKEMSYEWEGNAGIFFEEHSFRLSVDEYVTQDGWYWYQYRESDNFFEIDFEKLFNGKEIGDEFKFRLKLVYYFDNESENTQFLEYDVKVHKGEYTSPFFGWDGFLF
ncbi:MAG: hypothetical protein LBB56_02840 [Chitinispirillales bacterium]|nr:hypothetical protein [Chitinispirillales bacterium]